MPVVRLREGEVAVPISSFEEALVILVPEASLRKGSLGLPSQRQIQLGSTLQVHIS